MKKIYIFTAFVLLFNTCAFSQVRLSIVSDVEFDRDTVILGEEVNGTYYVKNTGDTAFQGQIHTTIRSQKGSFLANDSTHVALLEAIPTDSIQVSFSFFAMSTHFDPGNNIIVVWPTGTTIKGDTLEADSSSDINILVSQSTTIISSSSESLLSFYPNPASDRISLRTGNSTKLMYIKVYSLLGEELLSADGQTRELDLSGIKPGVLLLEVKLKDGNRQVFRIMKSD